MTWKIKFKKTFQKLQNGLNRKVLKEKVFFLKDFFFNREQKLIDDIVNK
jgi:hypothetical protein